VGHQPAQVRVSDPQEAVERRGCTLLLDEIAGAHVKLTDRRPLELFEGMTAGGKSRS